MALTSNDCDIPALFVDTQAPLDVLLEAADYRIRAVTQVMESLAMREEIHGDAVILHEFAHGIVAYWGGDYTIKERGGLTLNPLQYIHPVFSIVVPVLILIVGGVPLPGGATYIRRDLLKGDLWDTAVSLAGPAMDLLVFLPSDKKAK